jgi:hypothetical protein
MFNPATSLQQVTRDYGASTNSPRGFLRAPWNLNPSSHVTRYHSILGSDEVSRDGIVILFLWDLRDFVYY